jgi:hypothetical protein
VDNFSMINVAAARLGAACSAALPPWTNVAVAGANHAPARDLVRAAATAGAWLRAASQPVQAMNVQATLRPTSVETPMQPQFAAVMAADLLPTTATVTVKPKNVHKTRINAGGYGAMGPHPERERLA